MASADSQNVHYSWWIYVCLGMCAQCQYCMHDSSALANDSPSLSLSQVMSPSVLSLSSLSLSFQNLLQMVLQNAASQSEIAFSLIVWVILIVCSSFAAADAI